MDLEPLIGGLTVLIIFLGISSPLIIIGLIYYYKKRLEHKQIMAAIEKGIPLSELIPAKPTGPVWIKHLTFGIILLAIALGFYFVGPPGPKGPMLFLAIILGGVGIAQVIRGLLYRKYQPSDKNNIAEDKKQGGISPAPRPSE